MYAMKRTTIFLDDKTLAAVQKLARARGVSFAAAVREALVDYVATPERVRLPSITGQFASERTDTSARVDELLWCDPHV